LRRRGHHRAGLRLAGDGLLRDPGHRRARLSRGHGRDLRLGGPRRPRESPRRPVVRGRRPARSSFLMLRRAIGRFLRHHLAVAGLVFLMLIALTALLAPFLAPRSPTDVDVLAFRSPPSTAHLLGTDLIGRDVLSRLIYASRVSLSIGL